MKKIILGMVMVSVMSFGSEWDIKKDDSHCLVISKTAYTIMRARQVNVPMMNVLKNFSNQTAMTEISIYMTKEVYGKPRFGSAVYQENAQIDYANDWLKSCLAQEKKMK